MSANKPNPEEVQLVNFKITANHTGLQVKKNLRFILTSVAAVAFITTVGPGAYAQAQAPSSQRVAGLLPEVVVTATKRGAARAQDLPISIVAMDQELLEAMNVQNFADFSTSVAGLDLIDSGPGDKRYIIRGINGGGEAQVGIYYDNIPVTGLGGAAVEFGGTQPDPDLFDMERIEVIRGPQGTVYGANSMSGVVRFISNKPNLDEFEGAVEARLANIDGGGNNYSLKGMVNFPIVDERFAARLVAYTHEFGGFIDAVDIPLDYQKLDFFGPGRDAPPVDDRSVVATDINSGDSVGGRLSLLGQLAEDTTLLAQIHYEDRETVGTPHHRPDESRNVITNVFFGAAGDLNQVYYKQPVFNDELTMANLTLEHGFEWGNLSISASNFDREVFSEFDTTTPLRNLIPAPVVPFSGFLSRDHSAEMDSYEIRLATDLDGPVNVLLGAFYQDRVIEFENWLYLLSEPNVPDTSARRFNRVTRDQTKTTALFGEIYYQPNDAWEFTAGFRYFETDRDAVGQLLIPFFGFPGNPAPPENFSTDEDDTIFRLRAAWQVSDDVLGYAEASEGFRAGGTNSAQIAGIPGFYAPDQTTNFEVGIKTELLDQKLSINASVYHIIWSDMQLTQCFGFDGEPDPGCPFGAVVNVEGDVAESNGIEVDILATPTERWTLSAAISVNDATLTRDLGLGFDPGAVDGAELPGARKFTFAASAQYIFPLQNDWEGFARADFQHLDGVNVYTWNVQNVPSEDFQNLNLSIGAQSERYSAKLFLRNITDERGQLNAQNDFGWAGMFVPTQPRTIGITLNANF